MAKKLTERSTKAEILEAFEELKKEKAALESQVKQLNKQPQAALPIKQASVNEQSSTEARTKMNSAQTVQYKMKHTIESLAQLQLGFGGSVSELSEQLTAEASKLKALQELVGEEIQQLEDLHSLEIEENTLDTLIQSYEQSAKEFAEEISVQRETLEQQIQDLRKAWEKEQENHKREIKERNETQNKSRHRDAQEYRYELELARKIDIDQYAQQTKSLNKELEEIRLEQEKLWAERENAIAEREKQFAEAKLKVEEFPKQLEANIKNGKENGRNIGHYQAKVAADLYGKEVEGQKRYYELQIESLGETIKNQEARIQSLSKQLDSALKQVQDLAVKAIEGASNANSFQTIREIAVEQAKNLQKGK